VLLVADDRLDGLDASAVSKAKALIIVGTTLPEWANGAAVVLPIANFAEEEGTFTNVQGRVQRFMQAKAAPGVARPSWYVLGDLVALLGEGKGYYMASEAFAALAQSSPAFGGMSYDTLALKGRTVAGAEGAR
jgi:NADH-quinone oxidoreductase subunit G